MTRKRWLPLLFCIALGAAVSSFTLPLVRTEIAFRRLFSNDRPERLQAARFFRSHNASRATFTVQLSDDPITARKIIRKLENVERNDVFIDVVATLKSTGWWHAHEIPLDLWLRRCHLQLDTHSTDADVDVIGQLRTIDSSRRNADLEAIWLRAITESDSAVVREIALMEAVTWWGPYLALPFAQAALEDRTPRVQRLAWLIVGHLGAADELPANFAAMDRRVQSAALWALGQSGRLEAMPLINELNNAAVAAYLLAQFDTPETLAELESRWRQGDSHAAYHWLESTGSDDAAALQLVSSAQRAWLGYSPAPSTDDGDHRWLDRFAAWRERQPDRAYLADPVATDESVWAAVLLAERSMNFDTAQRTASIWITSLESNERRAGVLLSGLLKTYGQEIRDIGSATLDTPLRRTARLALMLTSVRPIPVISNERAYAWRLLDAAQAKGDSAHEPLIALLGIGDVNAAAFVLDRTLSTTPDGQRMLEHAWIIERFFPDSMAIAGIGCPWDDAVAGLQFDILRTALALCQRTETFDLQDRTFSLTFPRDDQSLHADDETGP